MFTKNNTNKFNMKKSILSTAIGLGLIHGASAAVISVNYDGNTGTQLTSTDVAGVEQVGNWNNSTDGSFTDAVNDSGTITTADFSATNTGEWRSTGSPFADPDNQMMEGVLYGNESGWTISGAQIPFASYDLYVYLASDAAGRDYKISDGTTTYWYDAMTPPTGSEVTYTIATTLTDPTTNNAAAANYVLFTGLSGDFTITLSGHPDGPDSSTNPTVSGLQLVAVPEPSTSALLGLASLGLVLRRRR